MARKVVTKKVDRMPTRCGCCFNDFVYVETVKSTFTEGAYVDLYVGWGCEKCCGVIARYGSKKKDKKTPVRKPRAPRVKKNSPTADVSPDTPPETGK